METGAESSAGAAAGRSRDERMRPLGRAVAWLERHQVLLYLAALTVGGVLGAAAPALAPAFGALITPALALLLFATFLAVPLTDLGRAVRDIRFLGTVLVLNFAVAPVVAFGLSRFVADDAGLLVGVLLVLLTPCIDYVIVFTGLAGGAKARLLAATPLLMLLQLVLLPLYLLLFAGGEAAAAIEPGPFAEAFLLLIVLPLGAAALVQLLARGRRTAAPAAVPPAAARPARAAGIPRAARAVEAAATAAMVPLMMLVLLVVVGSQIAAVGGSAVELLRLLPLYLAFLALMLGLGLAAARVARLDARGGRALVFSGATRNSLVVLPLALALPAQLGLAPLAVVTQTLVELVGLLVLVRLIPRLLPDRGTRP